MKRLAVQRRLLTLLLATAMIVGACVLDTETEVLLRTGDCLEPGPDAIALDLGFLEYLGPDEASGNARIYPLEQDGFLNPVGALEQDNYINATSDCAGVPLATTQIVTDPRFTPVPNGYGSFPLECAPYGFPEWGELGDFYVDVPEGSAADIVCLGPFDRPAK